MEPEFVNILCCDADSALQVPREIAIKSETIKDLITDANSGGDIPLDNISLKTWQSVQRFLETESLGDSTPRQVLWLIIAANHLNIPSLLNKCAEKIAENLDTTENIEESLELPPLKEEEAAEVEEQVRKENPWTNKI